MRKTIILITLSLLVVESIAQVKQARRWHYRTFYESTTLVVMDEQPLSRYNDRLKEEMERFWTVTPYEFITRDEFNRKRTNDNYSFLILSNIKQRRIPHVFKFINFVLGDTDRDFNRMPDLGSIPLAYKDADENSFLYMMGTFVQFMNNYAKESGGPPQMNLARFLNVRDSEVQNKVLWLLEQQLAPEINSVEKIRKYYPYPVKIVTKDDIQEAITQQRDDIAFLHKIGPEGLIRQGKCFKFIVTTDGKVLFSSDHDTDRNNPDALLVEDLERMAR